jgi:hypothetical protein
MVVVAAMMNHPFGHGRRQLSVFNCQFSVLEPTLMTPFISAPFAALPLNLNCVLAFPTNN